MAGHSKWSNIQHRKGRQDARRARLFAKLIREVTVAARLGGAEPGSNPRLRLALEQAATNNVPKDSLTRAMQRGDPQDGRELEELLLEAFGPGGTAILIESLTDNHTRTIAEVRHCLNKSGAGKLADGDVGRLFRRMGRVRLAPGAREEEALEAVLENGAEDVATEHGQLVIYCSMEHLQAVRNALDSTGLRVEAAECLMRPEQRLPLEAADARRLEQLLGALEELQDVQKVYSNGPVPERADGAYRTEH